MRLCCQVKHHIGLHVAHQRIHSGAITKIDVNRFDMIAKRRQVGDAAACDAPHLVVRCSKQMICQVAARKAVDARNQCPHARYHK